MGTTYKAKFSKKLANFEILLGKIKEFSVNMDEIFRKELKEVPMMQW